MRSVSRKRDLRERVLGPYPHHRGWRVIVVGTDGRRVPHGFEDRAVADQFKAIAERKISTIIHTTETALTAWLKDLRQRKLSERTVEGYEWAVRTFWPTTRPLGVLNPKNCAARYTELGTTLSVDSHRNALKMAKSFLTWCIGKGWLRVNPLAGVVGVGKRKKGKPQLRIDEARKFYAHAVKLAGEGDQGAIAALMCLLLTLRSESEALKRVVRDLDDDGRILWVDDSKTESGRRVEEVPEDLRPALLALAKGKVGGAFLFRRRDRKWLWDEVKRLCEEAEVPRVSPHGLRGMHATIARAHAGKTAQAVAGALGHASPRVTEEHYTDQVEVQREDRKRSMAVLQGGRR